MRSAVTTGRNLLAAMLLLLVACSTPEKRVRVLSFFFDGVPGSETSEASSPTATERAVMAPEQSEQSGKVRRGKAEREPVIRSTHKPYRERQCDRCHDRSSATLLRVSKRDLCFQCHKRARFQGQYVHGPVAVRQCLTCHLPHSSVRPALLRETGAALCFQCHEEEDVRKVRDHMGLQECLSCHDPHATDLPMFVRVRQREGGGR